MSKTTLATVKVMLSYNYCHFEVSKQIEGDGITQQDIDNARKDCQRLADKAVKQYQVAKDGESKRANSSIERSQLQRDVAQIRQKDPVDWSIYDKAKIKALEDYNHEAYYDYMDDDQYSIG